jgi:NADH-quinone oxidoreductase subunit C
MSKLPFDILLILVKDICKHADPVVIENSTPKCIVVSELDIQSVCEHLHKNPTSYFDMLSCVTAIDNGPGAGTMEVVYNLYSIPFDHHLALKVILGRDNPIVSSVASIWKTADWQEREAYDMFGIIFSGHPDLRRILLPADWDGFPLRKDYKQQEKYRSIKVEY